MPETPDSLSAIERLYRIGDPRNTWQWREGDPDYVAEFGLCPAHIPALIEIARQWADRGEWPKDDTLYAPVHAWRALGQLGAVEAVEPLLAMQNSLDEVGDDWYLEEFHDVFGLIGPAAVPAMAAYLTDGSNSEFGRVSSANGLCEIGKRHPETHQQVVELLATQLARREPDVYSLNGLLVGYLVDLKAVESAEVIERAFAAGVVDETICGDWPEIRQELAVSELGLVPERPKPDRGLGPLRFFDQPLSTGHLKQNLQRKKDKAKRKQQQKARKRNRKRR
ncbi:MAG: hypothetical protein ISR77_11410 [Pirellulaceae bacterium]|nr:hypothetical protein [Pirellulaceae bacterium]